MLAVVPTKYSIVLCGRGPGRWGAADARPRLKLAICVPSQMEKLACGGFCASPSLDGTLRADLRSFKRAPARLSDISSVVAGKRRDFCRLCSAIAHTPQVRQAAET